MDILAAVADTILGRRLLEPEEKLILAVSGGPDSTALVDLMVRFSREHFPLELAIACLNHGLWPEARENIDRISALAATYGLRLFWQQIYLLEGGDTAIEARGRDIRYRFLEKTALEFGARKVAAGHHADDQAETVLLRLLMGGGIYGLAAIPYERPICDNSSVSLIRPLLDVRKADLLSYLQRQGLTWWDDPSNYYLEYTRNRTRHDIIPFLQRHGYPRVVEALCRTAERCREVVEFLESEADRLYLEAAGAWCGKSDVEELLAILEGEKRICAIANDRWDRISPALLPMVMRRIFAAIGSEEKALREHHYRMLSRGDKCCRKLPGGVRMWRSLTHTCFFREKAPDFSLPQTLEIPGRVPVSPHAAIEAQPVDQRDIPTASLLEVGLCLKSVQGPLAVRFLKEGDAVCPLGSPGRRKVARILADAKIPRPLRPLIPAVTDRDGRIIWLPGICIAHHCRITVASEKVLRLRILRHS